MESKQDSFLSNVVKGVTGRIGSIAKNRYRKAGLNWYQIKYLKHLPYNQPQSFKFNNWNVEFRNPPEFLHSVEEIFVEEIYKMDFENEHPFIIDCGANIGMSIFYYKSRHPGAEIIAFEPDNSNFSYLEKNITVNQLSDVELRNEAIWKENTSLQFASEGTLGSKIDDSGTAAQTVKATRLRDLLNKKVDFLKLDIEGAEYEVVKDCRDVLNVCGKIFIEYHGQFTSSNQLIEILSIIQQNGFGYYIREAAPVYPTPFYRHAESKTDWDLQLNIFCFKVPA